MDTRQISSIITQRHGLITRAEAESRGLSSSSWYRAIAAGRLVEVFRGVACQPGTALTPTVRIAAAVMAAGPGAMASHRSAAYLWGLDVRGDDPIDIVRIGRASRIVQPGVVIHRPADHIDLRPMIRSGVRTTNPVRLLCDLGSVAPHAVDGALVEFRVRGLVPLSAARAALARHEGHGRHGIRALRDSIALQALQDKPPDSVLEERMARLTARHAIPPVEFHAMIAGYEVDFSVIDTPIVLECEGWESHGRDPEQFAFDKERTAALVAAGYVVVPFTWMQIVRRPEHVVRRILDVVGRWSPGLVRSGSDPYRKPGRSRPR